MRPSTVPLVSNSRREPSATATAQTKRAVRAALGQAVEAPEDRREALRVRRRRGEIARRAHAGRAAERVHFESGVLGQRRDRGWPRRSPGPSVARWPRSCRRSPPARRSAAGRPASGAPAADRATGAGSRAPCRGSWWPARGRAWRRQRPRIAPTMARCCSISRSMPVAGQDEQAVERLLVERLAFGGALDLDEAAVAGLDDVHVDLGLRVLLVGQVEQRHAGRRCRRWWRRRSRSPGSMLSWSACFSLPKASTMATNAPVIEAVRVPPSAWMTSQSSQSVRSPRRFEPHHRAHRTADQPLDLHRPPADLALRRLARGAGVGGARQHAVFGRDPALAGAAQERRHAIFDRRRADRPWCDPPR